MKHTFLVSDESINSHGFKVLTSGIKTDKFLKNPIMLYQHNRENVIGRWENLRIDGDIMYADAIFDIEDLFAQTIWRKVEKGFLRASSLGLEIIDKEIINGELVATSTELLEISIVDIGSNSNALKLYNTKDFKHLNFNKSMNELLQALIVLLELEPNAKEQDILKRVESLLELEESQKSLQKNEITEILNNSVAQGKITGQMIPQFQKMLKMDFSGTKQLLNSMPEKQTLSDKIQNTGFEVKSNSHEKPKHLWRLEDYRKFAPNELRDNPQLYKELKQKENSITE